MSLSPLSAVVLRAATLGDIEPLYVIHCAALKAYVKATWGWDEQWQANFLREHFKTVFCQVICYQGTRHWLSGRFDAARCDYSA